MTFLQITGDKAGSGNASNPDAGDSFSEKSNNNQLLDKKAEKYLREAGNIEDLPDAEERRDLDEKDNQ